MKRRILDRARPCYDGSQWLLQTYYDRPTAAFVDAKGVEVTFDQWEMITEAYSFFIDGENADLPDPVGEGYVGREVDAGVFFAIDKKVLGVAAGQAPTSASERQQRLNEVFGILAHRATFYRERRTEEVSPGPDGILLIDRRQGEIRPRRKKV
ncbi:MULTISPECIES: hypothetical protein [unclassified Bradyrhizobium]|uniref:hypothetical protein n=1 Tax=unclassified Bradyrhizobium TaxID=2631580 RepID=UPI00037E2422|nr:MULTISPECIES: hypothetical protein [unclassified Bradyrhizobium]